MISKRLFQSVTWASTLVLLILSISMMIGGGLTQTQLGGVTLAVGMVLFVFTIVYAAIMAEAEGMFV